MLLYVVTVHLIWLTVGKCLRQTLANMFFSKLCPSSSLNTSINKDRLDINTKSKTEHSVPRSDIIVNRNSQWRAIMIPKPPTLFGVAFFTPKKNRRPKSWCLLSTFVALKSWIKSPSRPGSFPGGDLDGKKNMAPRTLSEIIAPHEHFPGQSATGWWLNQPLWKILVKLGIFSKEAWKKNVGNHHPD